MDQCLDDPKIHLVETLSIYVEHLERLGSGILAHDTPRSDLGEISYPSEKIISDAGRAARASGHLQGTLLVDRHPK